MTNTQAKIGLGIIGCGKISQAYFDGAKTFEVLHIVACADLNADTAQAKAKENGCQALSMADLLAHPDIQLVINLTIPAAHAAVSCDILNAGKHVYSDNMRSIGVADMAGAILHGRPHRASGALACHVLEVMHAFDLSSESGRAIEIESKPDRPAALPAGLAEGQGTSLPGS